LTGWLIDPDFTGLREPGTLNRLSVEERDEWLALWKQSHALIERVTSP
jgi:hypothetical protein